MILMIVTTIIDGDDMMIFNWFLLQTSFCNIFHNHSDYVVIFPILPH